MDKKPHLLYERISHFNDKILTDLSDGRVRFSHQGRGCIEDQELNIARRLASYYKVDILFCLFVT